MNQKFYSMSKTLWENPSELRRNRLIFNSTVVKLSDYSYNIYVKTITKPGKGGTQYKNCRSVSLMNIDDK